MAKRWQDDKRTLAFAALVLLAACNEALPPKSVEGGDKFSRATVAAGPPDVWIDTTTTRGSRVVCYSYAASGYVTGRSLSCLVLPPAPPQP